MITAELEFKRIQTYLFSSPRLRAMLGANARLGRVIRMELPKLASEMGAKAQPDLIQELPQASKQDPLNNAESLMRDDPQAIYCDYGVLVRDGGHFRATFESPEAAKAFISRTFALLYEKLPGILVEAKLDGKRLSTEDWGEMPFQHPIFQVSHAFGDRPASKRDRERFVAAEEEQLEAVGKRFREDNQDVIGFLQHQGIVPAPEKPPEQIADLKDPRGMIALIHADGNGIGARYTRWRNQSSAEGLLGEAHGERFFHSMRVAVRRALVTALREIFSNAPGAYQLLMLGGDDLLLVCAASHALPFLLAYAKALADFPLADGTPLTIGAGVAIAKDTFPLYRLHAIAETLADSAKQRYRANPQLGSVLDWHITTNTWVDDPMAERRMENLAPGAILSGRPYPVLNQTDETSLETLVRSTQSLIATPNLARSQLRSLVEAMREGKALGELAWQELPNNTRQALITALGRTSPWQAHGGDERVSDIADRVEIYELLRIDGQNDSEKGTP
jgi:hypothetical protein